MLLTACDRRGRVAGDETDDAAPQPEWQLVGSGLSATLFSIDAASDRDVLAVGADKGTGPLVLHFDGSAWTRLETGQRGDLWWVHAFPDGTALLGGGGGMVLHYEGGTFTRLPTPGLARDTVFGVWGSSASDFYAAGSASDRNGFVWHFRDGSFTSEVLPPDVPLMPMGQPPGYFKVWGADDDVWVVGTYGMVLHKKGDGGFAIVPSGTRDALFTVHGSGGHGARVLAVGGGSNGVVLEGDARALHDVSPSGAAVFQGVFTSARGDWVSGERGSVFFRQGEEPFHAVEHGLPIPPGLSLHTIVARGSGSVWAAGGNVFSMARDQGLVVHYGAPVSAIDPEIERLPSFSHRCPAEAVLVAKDKSVARRWDEQALAAIRRDAPRPTVAARNLFHFSAAMWDAWAAYDSRAEGVFVHERVAADDVEGSRAEAMSYAAYGILEARYRHADASAVTLACLELVMRDMGYDPTDVRDKGDDPIALGNRIAHRILAATKDDGSNEANDYKDPDPFVPSNPAMIFEHPGAPMSDPDAWQPLFLRSGAQTFVASQWGRVTPFAMKRGASDGPWVDAGPPPKMGPRMKTWIVEILRDQSELEAEPSLPPTRADVARVEAVLWNEGPSSETVPGYWNVLANQVSDSPALARRLFGKGAPADALSWDAHLYLALNGALHDAAVATWDAKRRAPTPRPVSLVRWMGGHGQSSDPGGPSYSEDGLPLVPGLIEVVTAESSQEGQRHEGLARYVGQVVVRGWEGEPGDRARQTSRVVWERAVDWVPFQRSAVGSPASPGFVSEESAFAFAAAEVLAGLTGSASFPGRGAHDLCDAPASMFLGIEKGPSQRVKLGWGESFVGTAARVGESGLLRGVHIAPDTEAGRRVGRSAGRGAVARVRGLFAAP